MNQTRVVNLILGALFIASQAGVVWGMTHLCHAAIETYGNAESQQEWDRWRSDVAKQSQAFENAEKDQALGEPLAGPLPPVKRRVSRAAEPPALLLMRDRFEVCLVAAMLLSGAMFGSVLLLVRGALLRGGAAHLEEEEEDEGSPDAL